MKTKQLIALLLSLVMVVGMVPISALANEPSVTITGGELIASLDRTSAGLGYQYIPVYC